MKELNSISLDFLDDTLAMSLLGSNGELLDYNSKFQELLNNEVLELGKPHPVFVNIYQNEKDLLEFKENLSLGKPWKKVFPFKDGTGELLWLKATLIPKIREGKVSATLGIFQNITNKKKLEYNKEQFSELLAVGTWEYNIEANTFNGDEGFYRLLGIKPNESNPVEAWYSIINPEDHADIITQLQAHVTKNIDHLDLIYRINVNGSEKYVNSKGKIREYFPDGRPLKMYGVIYDITALKETEKSLNLATKLATIGEMSGNIAHEVNNPLTAISMVATQLKAAIKAQDFTIEKQIEFLDKIVNTANRVGKIVKSLQSMSRESSADPLELKEVNELLYEINLICANALKEERINFTVESNLPPKVFINCRPSEISQVLLNLISNAKDAVSSVKDKKISIQALIQDSNIKFLISDNGVGVAPEIQSKIMDPFFTTKANGKGTGLGLSISRQIIMNHKGELKFIPKLGATCFEVTLPLVKSNT